MAKKKAGFYAVAKGRKPGIYHSWPECEAQVKGFGGATYKFFPTQDGALAYIKQHNQDYKVEHKQCTPPRQQQTSDKSLCSADFIGCEDECAQSSITPLKIGRRGQDDSSSTSLTKRQKKLERRAKRAARLLASPHNDSNETCRRGAKRSAASEASANHPKKKAKPDQLESESNTDLEVDSNVRIIKVYTDGACSDNGKWKAKAGYGVYWPESQDVKSDLYGRNESARVPGKQTNQRAELLAIIRAIQICPDKAALLIIHTDSKYSINTIDTWQKAWRQNRWRKADGEPVLNRDLIRRLESEMRSRSHRPKLVKVKGHSSCKGNREADKLAVNGRKLPDVPAHLVPKYEPPDSEDDSKTFTAEETAIQCWVKRGYTREQAQQKVAGLVSR